MCVGGGDESVVECVCVSVGGGDEDVVEGVCVLGVGTRVQLYVCVSLCVIEAMCMCVGVCE